MLILAGLEPAIPWFVVRCLIHWATGPDLVEPPLSFSFITPIFNMQYSLGHIATLIDTTASINWINTRASVWLRLSILSLMRYSLGIDSLGYRYYNWKYMWPKAISPDNNFTIFIARPAQLVFIPSVCKIGCNKLACIAQIRLDQFDGRVAHW